MSKRLYLLVGIAIGVLGSTPILFSLSTRSLGATGGWTDIPLWMTSPNCSLILHARAKSISPPTEFEYALTVLSGSRKLDLDIPDDSNGGDPVIVYALRSAATDEGPSTVVLVDVVGQGHAVVLDPVALRVCEFDTYRERLDLSADTKFIAAEISEAWKIHFSDAQWRYVATFDRIREAGWAVGRGDTWPAPDANPGNSPTSG